MGCIFAGVAWGTAWWFIARDPSGKQSRRYTSGWIILALTVGIGVAGQQGWMQWPHFFNNRLYIDFRQGEYVYISQHYGFLWLFLVGVPWAGLGACLLAWCGSQRPTRAWQWGLRIACGFGMSYLLVFLLARFPGFFLPLYDSLEAKYNDLDSHRNLWKLVRDTRECLAHLGLYLGFLAFEVGRRAWKNVTLITTVGLVNGVGWALCQNWMWADKIWPDEGFNWWRCWESSGGISIGIAYGIAYYLVNRRMREREAARPETRLAHGRVNLQWLSVYLGLLLVLGYFVIQELELWGIAYLVLGTIFGIAYYMKNRGTLGENRTQRHYDPNLERLGAYTGLLFGVLISVMNGLRGVAIVHNQDEEVWRGILTNTMGPLIFVCFALVVFRILSRPISRDSRSDVFPHAYLLVWCVVIVLNLIAQGITFQPSNWSEMAFSLYYLLLFSTTAVILYHFQCTKRQPFGHCQESTTD